MNKFPKINKNCCSVMIKLEIGVFGIIYGLPTDVCIVIDKFNISKTEGGFFSSDFVKCLRIAR